MKGQRLRTSHIKIEFAEIPVLLLRGKLPALDAGTYSYVDLVKHAQQDYALLQRPPQAVFEPQFLSLTVNDQKVRLSPLETAVYLLFAEARVSSCGRAECSGCEKCTFLATDFLGNDGVASVRVALKRLKTKDVRLEELKGWGSADPMGARKAVPRGEKPD